MALIKLLQNNETDNTETSSSAKSFLSNTIRSILFSSGSGKESEIDKRLKKISLKEVSDHDCSNDCWIIIYDRVYDVTEFLNHVSIIYLKLINLKLREIANENLILHCLIHQLTD